MQVSRSVPSARSCSTAYKPTERKTVSRGGGFSSLAPKSRAIFTDLVSAEIRAPGRCSIRHTTYAPVEWCSLRTNAEEGQLSLRLRASQNRAPRERLHVRHCLREVVILRAKKERPTLTRWNATRKRTGCECTSVYTNTFEYIFKAPRAFGHLGT